MNTTKSKSSFSPLWARFAVLMALLIGNLHVMAYDFMVDGIAYNYNADGASVSITYTAVPDDNNPYANYTDVTSIVVPSSVNYEGKEYAVTAIGDGAFYQCLALKKAILPDGLKSIGSFAFAASYFLESINIPTTVTDIEEAAFFGTAISEIVIPNTVTNLGEAAFGGCIELSQVSLPNSFIDIPPSLFMGCKKLTRITLPPHVSNIGEQAFAVSGIQSIDWPESLKSIQKRAFWMCDRLTSIELPDSVSWIGGASFSQCRNLERVTLSNDLFSVGAESFCECNKLKDVVFGPNVRRIESQAFMKTGLSNVTLPESLEFIGHDAFSECSQLENIHFSDATTIIEDYAFANCEKLRYVNLPESLSSISFALFSGCSLEDIYIPSSVSSIDGSAFQRCKFKELEFPNSITSIGCMAFKNCSELTRVIIPNSVTDLSTFVFEKCGSLQEITLGDGVKEVGFGLLWHCNSLKTITLGAGIRIIRDNGSNWPLGSCKNLTRLYNRNPNPISINEAVLQEVNYSHCVLYVPRGSADLYRSAPVWQRFVHIKEFDPNLPTSFIEGDVNFDGEVNIADVNTLVDLIMSDDPFKADADTDVNQDGEVNIADINTVINMILSGE